jgi:uncharacterized membrane protein YgdD (TMEM256/DUF423 family)
VISIRWSAAVAAHLVARSLLRLRRRSSSTSRPVEQNAVQIGGMKSDRLFAAAGALPAAGAVVLGAFGAHALRARISADLLGTFETGARCQMYHALARFAAASACGRHLDSLVELPGWLFIARIGLFCGSLYILALTGARWLGAVTPLGGLSYVAGWIVLFIVLLKPGK